MLIPKHVISQESQLLGTVEPPPPSYTRPRSPAASTPKQGCQLDLVQQIDCGNQPNVTIKLSYPGTTVQQVDTYFLQLGLLLYLFFAVIGWC